MSLTRHATSPAGGGKCKFVLRPKVCGKAKFFRASPYHPPDLYPRADTWLPPRGSWHRVRKRPVTERGAAAGGRNSRKPKSPRPFGRGLWLSGRLGGAAACGVSGRRCRCRRRGGRRRAEGGPAARTRRHPPRAKAQSPPRTGWAQPGQQWARTRARRPQRVQPRQPRGQPKHPARQDSSRRAQPRHPQAQRVR